MPKNLTQLNLSLNQIQTIADNAFDECCSNLRILNLSHNKINNLTPRHFEKLKKLEIIYLASNEITSLDADTFKTLNNLKQLDLSKNSIELQSTPTKGFLVQSSLETLNLDNCNIDEIPDDTFINMTQLINLTLSGNPIAKNLDTSAFEILRNLVTLRMPNLEEGTVFTLCDKLVAIDAIKFDEYNISCLLFVNEESFIESILPNDPEPPIDEPKIGSVILQPSTTLKSTAAPTTTTTTTSSPAELPIPQDTTTNVSQIEKIETSDENKANRTESEPTTAEIDIDNETIKFMLVGESRCFTTKFDDV